MWLWFATSFHSQLSDRFPLRWHLLLDAAPKSGTAPKWDSCFPACQAASVTSSPRCSFVTQQHWQQQLPRQNLSGGHANEAPLHRTLITPTVAVTAAPPPLYLCPAPSECRDPFICDPSASWPNLCWHVDAQPSSPLTYKLAQDPTSLLQHLKWEKQNVFFEHENSRYGPMNNTTSR